MIGGPFHAETITLVTVATGLPDENGVPTKVTTSRDIPGCNVQPYVTRGGIEVVTDQDLVTDRYQVSCPLGSGIESVDRIVWRGTTYEVWGKPQDYITGIGRLDHTEFYMTRFEG